MSDVTRSVKKVRQRQRAQAHDDRAKDLVEVEDELGKTCLQCTSSQCTPSQYTPSTHPINPLYSLNLLIQNTIFRTLQGPLREGTGSAAGREGPAGRAVEGLS